MLAVLRPIWNEKTITAARLQKRIERIFDYAAARHWHDGNNPASWRSHLSYILPSPAKITEPTHHFAIPRHDLPAAMQALCRSQGISALVVRWAALTACRSNEARGATWQEIDQQAGIWTIPKERMKAGTSHRVPLSSQALEILNIIIPLRNDRHGGLLFPNSRHLPLSDVALSKAIKLAAQDQRATVHGLRSVFRDWAAEQAECTREVAEIALAHNVKGKTESAYWRGDLLEKRQLLMEAWGAFCMGDPAALNINKPEKHRIISESNNLLFQK